MFLASNAKIDTFDFFFQQEYTLKIEFEHIQSAHCENGVTTNLLRHHGLTQLTEPLVFGIGSGLFYIHIPIMKLNDGPAISYRNRPGIIFERTCRSLGVSVKRKKFRDKKTAEKQLQEKLNANQPVGCQVGVYYLTYLPKEYRFHFNAHNLVVYGKENDTYLISDPVMETVTTLSGYELERVRFAKGPLAPRGQLYYPEKIKPVGDDMIRRAIINGIKLNIRDMLEIPLWFAGVRGIRHTGKKIKTWREKMGVKKAGSYLAQLVRMQEEIGTGGGGFRFIYGAFLQQAQQYLDEPQLQRASELITKSGDTWRDVAVRCAGIYKGRLGSQQDFNEIGDQLFEIAAIEKEVFTKLKKIMEHR